MALTFTNGGTDVVLSPAATSIDNLQAGTVIIWAYPTSVANVFRALTNKGFVDGDTGWCLFKRGADGTSFGLLVGRTGSIQTASSATGSLAADTWCYVAASWDIANGGPKTYSGRLTSIATDVTATSADGSGAYRDDSAHSLGLGNEASFSGGARNAGWPGRIAFVGVWDRVLTPGEIRAQQFRPHATPGCVVFMHLGFDGTTSVVDWSGNKNNGTVTGATVAAHVPLMPALGIDSGWRGAFTAAGGTARNLAAELAGTAHVDAALTLTRRLAAELAGTAHTDGALTVTRRITADLAGTAHTDAALAITRRPAADLTATAVVDGLLNVTRKVAAELAGTAALDGALAIQRNLAADLVGTAHIDASLTVGSEITANLTGTAVLDAALTLTRRPATDLVGTAHVDATLTLTRRLTADLSGTAALDCTLAVSRRIGAELVGVAVLDGVLTVTSAEPSLLVDEIARLLSDAGVGINLEDAQAGDPASTFYLARGFMPDSTALPDRMIAIRETGGQWQLPGTGVDRPSFQVVVRGAPMTQVSSAYEEADAASLAVRDALHFETGMTVLDAYYPGIIATQEPFPAGDDLLQRPVFVCNFRAWRQAVE